MRIVTYSQDIISLFDSEFIAASLQDGLFTFTRPNGQVVEVTLPTRAEIAKLPVPHLSSMPKGHDAQIYPASIAHKPSLPVNTPPDSENLISQVVITNRQPDMSAPESKNKFGLSLTAPIPDLITQKLITCSEPGTSTLSSNSGPSSFVSPKSTALLQKPNDKVATLTQDTGSSNTEPIPVSSIERETIKNESTGRNDDKGSGLRTNVTHSSSSPGSSNRPSLEVANSQHSKTEDNYGSELYLQQLEDLKVRVSDLQSAWNEADVKGLNQKLESLKNRSDKIKDDFEKFVFPAIEELQDKVSENIAYIEDFEIKTMNNFENVQDDYELMDTRINEVLGCRDGKNNGSRPKKRQR